MLKCSSSILNVFFPDGKLDAKEAGTDSDHDDIPDYIDSGKDTDGDGIPDAADWQDTSSVPWYSALAIAERAHLVSLLIVAALLAIIVVSCCRRTCDRWRCQRDRFARPGTVSTQPISPVVPPGVHPSLSAQGIDDAIAAGMVCLLNVTSETLY